MGPRTCELAALECLRKYPVYLKWGCHVFLVVFDRFLFILAGNDDIRKSFDEFELGSDLVTDYRVSCH